MKEIPDKSIDLIVTDPPYNIGKADWDKIDNYIEWLGVRFKECERVLKDNGSFYFFHNDFLQIVEIQNWINRHSSFIFKQFIVWNKRFKEASNIGFLNGYIKTNQLRNYQKMSEYLLFYTFQDETGLTRIFGNDNCFKPIRDYLKKEKQKAGFKTCKQINRLLEVDDSGGGMASHYFGDKVGFKQWALPTKEMYKKLQTTGFFQREYEDLRREYEDLRYTFNNQKTHHSIWNYEVPNKNGHNTPKPEKLIENILLHSSNENDLILDPFLGSGTTAVACKSLKRDFIGIEINPEYVEIANKRLKHVQQEMFV